MRKILLAFMALLVLINQSYLSPLKVQAKKAQRTFKTEKYIGDDGKLHDSDELFVEESDLELIQINRNAQRLKNIQPRVVIEGGVKYVKLQEKEFKALQNSLTTIASLGQRLLTLEKTVSNVKEGLDTAKKVIDSLKKGFDGLKNIVDVVKTIVGVKDSDVPKTPDTGNSDSGTDDKAELPKEKVLDPDNVKYEVLISDEFESFRTLRMKNAVLDLTYNKNFLTIDSISGEGLRNFRYVPLGRDDAKVKTRILANIKKQSLDEQKIELDIKFKPRLPKKIQIGDSSEVDVQLAFPKRDGGILETDRSSRNKTIKVVGK